jgi:eukaryotic-like serine/threonine-protein kinase
MFTATQEPVAMVRINDSNPATDAVTALISEIRDLSLLTERQREKLDSYTSRERYPESAAELAAGLVAEGIFTQYQSRQMLKGKLAGLAFGSYVILDFLGKGSMAKVYKARHRMMGRIVALKVLDPRYVPSERTLARFRREMQLVGRLDHPNVVQAFDADRVDDCHFIAMEYSDGLTLYDLLEAKGVLPAATVVYYGLQAAEGLAHAHARGVLHRDIKPSNLVLTKGRNLKILDFGLGTLLEKDHLPAALTAAGITVGTPDYLSPEQARMIKLDARSDLYSLGCTLYHLLCGQVPFKGETSMDSIIGRLTGKAVPISEFRPELPPRLVQTIEKLMAIDPDDRFQTAEEAATALRSLLRPKSTSRKGPGVEATAAPPDASEPIPPAAPALLSDSPARTTPVTPPRLLRFEIRRPNLEWSSLRDRWRSRGTKTHQMIAVAVVAVAIVALLVTTVMLFVSGPLAVSGGASARQLSLMIESPQNGATVGMREILIGRMQSDGWPMIFVQADIPGQPWWCQSPVTSVEHGGFRSEVVFGDEQTPHGMQFRVVAVVAPTREAAHNFKLGAKHLVLPNGLPHTTEVVVSRK